MYFLIANLYVNKIHEFQKPRICIYKLIFFKKKGPENKKKKTKQDKSNIQNRKNKITLKEFEPIQNSYL